MKRILWVSAIAVTIFALGLDAVAQPGQGGQGRGQGQGQGARQTGQLQGPGQGQGRQQGQFAQGGAFGLGNLATFVRNTEVAKLVNISEMQATALNELFPRGQGAGGGQQGGQQLTGAERVAQQRTQTAERWAGIARVLNAEQLKKFNELYFQANVPVANPNAPANAPAPIMNLNAYVLGAVELTADQKEKITKIANDLADANTAAGGFGGGGGGQQLTPEERTARFAAARERNTKANDEILAVLTASQKAKVEELKAGAAAVQTTLRAGQPAGPGGGQQRGGQGGGAGAGPGAGSWQPGQDTPAAGQRARGNFPRTEN